MANLQKYIEYSREVQQARENNQPIVALESTIISHGMPYPQNVEMATTVEQIIRNNGAIPATIAIIVSATVIGIFLYVMTLQKTSLFGILKAQGFTNGYLANVVISQTLILALFGTAFGLLLTGVTGAFLPDAVPVKFDVLTLLVFAIVLMIVSVLGSLFSILTIRKIDPLKAIG